MLLAHHREECGVSLLFQDRCFPLVAVLSGGAGMLRCSYTLASPGFPFTSLLWDVGGASRWRTGTGKGKLTAAYDDVGSK